MDEERESIGVPHDILSLVCLLGEVPFNHEILREANALCHRLPVLNTFKFKTDFYDVSTHTHTHTSYTHSLNSR